MDDAVTKPASIAAVDWHCDRALRIVCDDAVAGVADALVASAVVRRALALRQPFLDVASNGWSLTGHPQFESGRFTGFQGSAAPLEPAEPVPENPLPSPDADARFAHEVRSPLNAIVGFAQMIETEALGPAPEAMREGARRILGIADSLVAALDDLTDSARLGLGRYPVEDGWIDARTLLERAEHRHRACATDRAARIELTPGLPLWTQMDPAALERLVERLLAALLTQMSAGETLTIAATAEPGDRLAIDMSRPARLADWTDDALRDPAADADTSGAAMLVGLGFSIRLVEQLAERLGGSLAIGAERFRLLLPALADRGVASAHPAP